MTAAAATDERPRRHRGALVRAAGALSVLLAVGAAGACGLSTNDEPETIRGNVPPDLLDTETAMTSTTEGQTGESTETETVTVWFLTLDSQGDTRLIDRPRQVPRPATQIQVLQTLITEPPTGFERAGGITTDIPEDVTITDTPRLRSDDGVLTVNLSDEFYDLQGETARNAFAQIVYTATELPNVHRVQFERDGEVFSAVDGDGQSSRAPLGKTDFTSLEPEADAAVADDAAADGQEAWVPTDPTAR